MRLWFLNPPHPSPIQRRWVASYHAPNFLCPPIELLGLAAWVRQRRGATVEVVDAIAERLDEGAVSRRMRRFGPDLVVALPGFEHFDDDMGALRRICRSAPGVPLVVFGHLATWTPERAIEAGATVALRGEPEQPMLDLLDADTVESACGQGIATAFGSGSVAPRWADLDAFPTPDHRLVDLRLYSESFVRGPTAAIQSTRGCPFDCAFCVRAYGRTLSRRSADRVVDDVEQLWAIGAQSFRFLDDTFTADRDHCEAVCAALRRSRRALPWTALTRLDRLDADLARELAASGCTRLYVGVESSDPAVRRRLDKRLSDESMLKGAAAARGAGLELCGFFLAGVPGDPGPAANAELARTLGLDFVIATRLRRWPHTTLGDGPAGDDPDDPTSFAQERTFYRSFYLRPRWLLQHAHLLLRTPTSTLRGAHAFASYAAGRLPSRDFI